MAIEMTEAGAGGGGGRGGGAETEVNGPAGAGGGGGGAEKMSPAARLFHAPRFNCYILAIMGCKTRINPSVVKAGLEETLLRHPRFSSKMVRRVLSFSSFSSCFFFPTFNKAFVLPCSLLMTQMEKSCPCSRCLFLRGGNCWFSLDTYDIFLLCFLTLGKQAYGF